MKEKIRRFFAAAVLLSLAAANTPSVFAALDEEEQGKWVSVGYGLLYDGWFNGTKGATTPLTVEFQKYYNSDTRYRIWRPYENITEVLGLQNTSECNGQIIIDFEDPECVLIEAGMPVGFKNSTFKPSNGAPGANPIGQFEWYAYNTYGYILSMGMPKQQAKSMIQALGGQKNTYVDGVVTVFDPLLGDENLNGTFKTTGWTSVIVFPWALGSDWTVAVEQDAFDFTIDDKPAETKYNADTKSYLFEGVSDGNILNATFKPEFAGYKVLDVTADPTSASNVTITENGFTIAYSDFSDEYTFSVTIASQTPAVVLDEEKLTVEPGESATVSVSIDNPCGTVFSGFQMSVALPNGMNLTGAKAGDALDGAVFKATLLKREDGTFGVMLVEETSTVGSNIKEGEVLKLTISADENATPVEGELVLSDMMFSTPNGLGMALEGSLHTEAELLVNASEVTLSSVSLEGITDKHDLKVSESLDITATLYPAVVTAPKIVWTADVNDAVKFEYSDDNQHNVKLTVLETAPTNAQVTITATVEATPDVNATYVINIADILLGDSNDNGNVDVTDVITTRNEILAMGGESINNNFCFINADVDKNGVIDVTDMSGTVKIALGGNPDSFVTVQSSLERPIYDFDCVSANVVDYEVAFRLTNPSKYVIFQADVTIPDGVAIEEIVPGAQASRHSVVHNIKSNVIRVIAYSLVNDTYINTDEPLFTIKASSKLNVSDIKLSNVIVTDENINRIELPYEVKNIPAGIANSVTDNMYVYGGINEVVVLNGEGADFAIYTLDGKLLKTFVANDAEVHVAVASGVYTVVSDGKAYKVIVK